MPTRTRCAASAHAGRTQHDLYYESEATRLVMTLPGRPTTTRTDQVPGQELPWIPGQRDGAVVAEAAPRSDRQLSIKPGRYFVRAAPDPARGTVGPCGREQHQGSGAELEAPSTTRGWSQGRRRASLASSMQAGTRANVAGRGRPLPDVSRLCDSICARPWRLVGMPSSFSDAPGCDSDRRRPVGSACACLDIGRWRPRGGSLVEPIFARTGDGIGVDQVPAVRGCACGWVMDLPAGLSGSSSAHGDSSCPRREPRPWDRAPT